MNYKHGKRHAKVYQVWLGMRARCSNPNSPAYVNYGGRGISVCARWQSFDHFYADMGDPPTGHSLERVDNDKGYEPSNVCWANRVTQNRNRRNIHTLTVHGVTRGMSEWAEIVGLSVKTISMRLAYGWSEEAAVTFPKVVKRAGLRHGKYAYEQQQ